MIKKIFLGFTLLIMFFSILTAKNKIEKHLNLTIKDAIRIGLENNLSVKLNKAQEEELKYQVGKIESLFWPHLRAEYNYDISSYSRELKTYFNSVFSSPYLGFTNTSEYTNVVRVFLEGFIYTWGKNSRKRRIAKLNLQIQQLLNQKKEKELIYQISKKYFEVIFNKVMFSAVAEYLGSYKSLYGYAKTEDDQLTLDDNYSFFTQKLFYYEKELNLSKIQLKRLMGIGNLTPEVSIEISEKYFPAQKKNFSRDDILTQAIHNRLDKTILEKKEKIIQNKISIKKKEYMPDVKFISEWDLINYQDADVRDLVKQNNQGLLAIKVDLPIFDGFQKANEIRGLQQKLKQVKYLEKQKVRDIVLDVDTALLNVERFWDSATTLTQKVITKRKLLNRYIEKLKNKKTSLDKLSNLYLQTFKAEEAKNKSFLNYNLSLINLYKITGIIAGS